MFVIYSLLQNPKLVGQQDQSSVCFQAGDFLLVLYMQYIAGNKKQKNSPELKKMVWEFKSGMLFV